MGKLRPQRAKQRALNEVQQNIKPHGAHGEDEEQESEAGIETAATSRQTTRQQRLTINQHHQQVVP